jgi:uncharacterized peroxidase-related enzyme
METFNLPTADTSDSVTSARLQAVADELGFVPNVFAAAAAARPALEAFIDLNRHFAATSLSATEREIVQTSTSVVNEASYCTAGHTAFSEMQHVDRDTIQAVRDDRAIDNAGHEALRLFTRRLVDQRGEVSPEEIAEFLAAGYSSAQVIEVILGITVKYFTNFTSKVSGIALDEPFSPHAWSPKGRDREAA